MAFAALANPMLYFDSRPVYLWVATWLVPAVGAACIFGLLALFFTERARRSWPGSAIMLAWVLLVLLLVGNGMNFRQMQQDAAAARTAAGLKPFTGTLDTPPALAVAPPAPAVDPATAEHYKRIYAAHPDANAISESPMFRAWLARNSDRQKIFDQGSTEAVIAVFSAYKASAGRD
jgi:hypothetical protein